MSSRTDRTISNEVNAAVCTTYSIREWSCSGGSCTAEAVSAHGRFLRIYPPSASKSSAGQIGPRSLVAVPRSNTGPTTALLSFALSCWSTRRMQSKPCAALRRRRRRRPQAKKGTDDALACSVYAVKALDQSHKWAQGHACRAARHAGRKWAESRTSTTLAQSQDSQRRDHRGICREGGIAVFDRPNTQSKQA